MTAAQPARPVIVLSRRLPPATEAELTGQYTVITNTDDTPLPAAELVSRCDRNRAVALVVTPTDRLSADTIRTLPDSLRLIATFSVGYDHIDIAAAKARGLTVTNTPGVLTDATADIALLLILGAARRASEGEREIRNASWTGWRPTHMMGSHLGGKRLGILGMGRIGQAVAVRARAFGMEIHYHNRSRLSPDQEQGAVFHPTADSLLTVSDVLSLHCPATAETTGFLNRDRIERLPPGAIVVNTARGAVVNDADLIAALRSGRLAAAGLDVFAGEPDLHPDYRELPNTFLLPHLGSATVETRMAMGACVIDSIQSITFNSSPTNAL